MPRTRIVGDPPVTGLGRTITPGDLATSRSAIELIAEERQTERFNIMLAQGVEQQRCGELDAARRTFTNVLTGARELQDAEVHARAALGLHGLGYSLASDLQPIDLLDEAFREVESVGKSLQIVQWKLSQTD